MKPFSPSQLIFLSLILAYPLYALATSLVPPHLETPHPILAETPVSEALQKSLTGDGPFVQDCRCLMRVAYEPRRQTIPSRASPSRAGVPVPPTSSLDLQRVPWQLQGKGKQPTAAISDSLIVIEVRDGRPQKASSSGQPEAIFTLDPTHDNLCFRMATFAVEEETPDPHRGPLRLIGHSAMC